MEYTYDFSAHSNADLRGITISGASGLSELALYHAAKIELTRRTEWLKG